MQRIQTNFLYFLIMISFVNAQNSYQNIIWMCEIELSSGMIDCKIETTDGELKYSVNKLEESFFMLNTAKYCLQGGVPKKIF